ncbi:FkbM family methyltransferase [Caldimonas brevitalea]|uniref:Methyltransferase FkbM domain-containing protein n=1 Tax=Caldimonas brevitalea TaxID=413882 RepID=A0A0G3BHB5_9BURK|nr:FkbM family methyltransferase [Caldimonas brevitalea]AKJ27363.1 hypothetical protein AAW51_0672 [Caldimonas brevitalea]
MQDRGTAHHPLDATRVRDIGRAQVLREFVLSRLAYRLGRAVRAKGYPVLAAVPSDAVGQHIFTDGLYEKDLLLSLFDTVLAGYRDEFAQGVALDVGANVGNHTLFLAPRFAQVVAVEPNPPIVKILQANIELNDVANVTVVPVGLGDEDADCRFVQNQSGNLGGSSFAGESARATAGRLRVLPVRRGDDVVQRLDLVRPVRLVKIDVEGYELRVLRGLQAVLDVDRPLVLFESNHSAGPGGGDEVASWLRQRGYRHLYSVGRRWDVPGPIRRVPKLRGLVELLLGCACGGHFWLRELEQLEERAYRLLLASPEALSLPQPS